MNPELLTQWLKAESQGDEDEAELALGRLFQQLPLPRTSSGFVSSVMARTSVAGRSKSWGRLLVALVVLAPAAGFWVPVALWLLSGAETGTVIRAVVGLIPFAARAVAEMAVHGQTLAAVLGAFWQVAATPHVLLFLALSAALTLGLGRALAFLISPRRRFDAQSAAHSA